MTTMAPATPREPVRQGRPPSVAGPPALGDRKGHLPGGLRAILAALLMPLTLAGTVACGAAHGQPSARSATGGAARRSSATPGGTAPPHPAGKPAKAKPTAVPIRLPPAVQEAGMAYDAANSTLVLFGGVGQSGQGLLGGTWIWNGTTWTEAHPASSPPPLAGPALAFDAAEGVVVLFGGQGADGLPLDATWTWNGTTWTEARPAVSPPARVGAAMAYDAAMGRVILFGGATPNGMSTPVALADTWVWSGRDWAELHPEAAPPARADAALAYDAATRGAVLFGGVAGGVPVGGTWIWNGTTWNRAHPAASPSPRAPAGMTYAAAARRLLLFGGSGAPPNFTLGDTWTWNGRDWTQAQGGPSPPAAGNAAVAYDAATQSVVALLAQNGSEEQWAWTPAGWRRQASTAFPCRKC